MTIYYCDELVDNAGEYELMNKESAQVICLDISQAVSVYEFQTKYLDALEVDIDSVLPIVFEMLSVKNEFMHRYDRHISDLMLIALDAAPPSYYEEMCRLTNEPITPHCDEESNATSNLLAIELYSNAIRSLGLFIYNKIQNICYTGKCMAYSLYSYENGHIYLIVNHVPVYRTKHTAKVVELSINSVLGKYGKTLES